MTAGFADRLAGVCARYGRLCVGIDPHDESLDDWGLPHDASGLERFGRGLVEALAGHVGVFKPQSAFFEAYGPAGTAVLASLLRDIEGAGALSVLDVKRGDIGSTMTAYARAYLADGAPWAADAITLSPYVGLGALAPAIDLAAASGRGVFVLARTSNPEGRDVQAATTGSATVAQTIVDEAGRANQRLGVPVVGVVIGATHADVGVDLSGFGGWVLAPGVGAQGGRLEALAGLFGSALPRVLPTLSREVARVGPGANALRDRVGDLRAISVEAQPVHSVTR